MKIKRFLISMLACSAMVACTNEDVLDNNEQNLKGNEYYVAVSFAMPGNGSSRALGSTPTFEDGTSAELKVNKATFFFMNAAGNSCADAFTLPTIANLDPWAGVDATGKANVDATSSPVIVMKNATEIPSSIIAILNADVTATRPTLAQLQALVDNYATDTYNAFNTTNGMVMSSTAYKDNNGELVIGAPVSVNNVYQDRNELTNKLNQGDKATAAMIPVVIPVEKVLAKVHVAQADKMTTDNLSYSVEDADQNAANNTINFTVKIDGWWLDSAPTNSYLLKNMEFTGLTGSWWNDVANKRSYWAQSSATAAYFNYKYSTMANNNDDLYCQENTLNNTLQTEDNDNVNNENQRTKVVVAATLMNGENPVSLVKWFGQYYTEAGFLATVANLSDVKKYYKQTAENTYESLAVSDLKIVYNTDKSTNTEASSGTQEDITVGTNKEEIRNYEAVVVLGDKVTELYTLSNTNGTTVAAKADLDAVNEELKGITRMQFWNGGKTYYYVDLEHCSVAEDQAAQYGIVRNHLYNLTLNGINGLGTPVPNPNKVIIPEKPGDSDMDTYISAQIEILSYRVVSQNVTLQ